MKNFFACTATICTLGMGISQSAWADDALYSPPQQLKNCHKVVNNEIVCDFDNTFLTIYLTHATTALHGDYHFYAAAAWPDAEAAYYYYKNADNNVIVLQTGFMDLIKPALTAANTQWQAPGTDGWRSCISTNPADCPFTHTPWHPLTALPVANPAIVAPAAHLKHQTQPLTLTVENNDSPHVRTRFINIINYTNAPVTLHSDDFNSGNITWINRKITPQPNPVTVASYDRLPMQKIMFDVQLGAGLRNADNTAVFVLNDKKLKGINTALTLDHQYIEAIPKFDKKGDITIIIQKEDLSK